MIEAHEWEQLEGKYWKCGVAEQHELVITDWSIKPVSFKDQPSKPHLCFHVTRIDGKAVDKEFQTRNHGLIVSLSPRIMEAQRSGKTQLLLWISRGLANDYRVSVPPGGV